MTMSKTTATRQSGRPRRGGWSRTYQVLGPVELSAQEQEIADGQMAVLEDDPGESISTALRWRKAQLDVVRQAARLAGVPYQAYLKQAAMRCAIADLRAAREAGVELG